MSLSSYLLKRWFPYLSQLHARHRAAKAARNALRSRLARYVRPRLEGLEERIVPDAYSFQHYEALPGGGEQLAPSVGSYTDITKWVDLTPPGGGQPIPATQLPGASDVADIPVGASCTLNSSSEYALAQLTVAGSMTIASNLTIAPGGTVPSGDGSATVNPGGSMVVGNPNTSGDDPTLDATALNDFGTVTVGAAAGGSVGTISVEDAAIGNSLGGTLNIGDPGSGMSGSVDVQNDANISGNYDS